MPFCAQNIDKAIVALKEVLNKLSRNKKRSDPEVLHKGFLAFVTTVCSDEDGSPANQRCKNPLEASERDCWPMCRKLVGNLDETQKKAIERLIRAVVHRHNMMEYEVDTGERIRTHYLNRLTKGTFPGNVIFALADELHAHIFHR